MDGPLLEHSDSDSGDSWTLLESNPAFADEAPEFADIPVESPVLEIHEKDEDTDGISIISDSDHESHSADQMNCDKLIPEVMPLTEKDIPQYVSVDPHVSSFTSNEPSRANNDHLGDSNKHRIYVHRRNKQLSTVLNIIMLGSVITAAGVAIGHMWGAKNECSVHSPQAVNKILSNLYKLQEENAYLRNKLKELSQYHKTQQKLPVKQNRCKKMFEEPLSNKKIVRLTKCVDNKDNESDKLESHFVMPLYEKEFITDVKKLENIYRENKNWLDEEITQRLKLEEEIWSNNVNELTKSDQTRKKSQLPDSVNYQSTSSHITTNTSKAKPVHEPLIKISYADSLKTVKYIKQINKTDDNKSFPNITSGFPNKKKRISVNQKRSQNITSDDEIKKDDRYTGHKNKQGKKKYKSFKKQKRQNKYEQWEMKGGFIKDYDDISNLSQDIEVTYNNAAHKLESVNKKKNVSDIFTETESGSTQNGDKFQKDKVKINKDSQNWYDKRAELRNEARKKLEKELFGEVANKARWYFRRMQKREQSRIKDNNTNKKLNNKRDMNYKLKH